MNSHFEFRVGGHTKDPTPEFEAWWAVEKEWCDSHAERGAAQPRPRSMLPATCLAAGDDADPEYIRAGGASAVASPIESEPSPIPRPQVLRVSIEELIAEIVRETLAPLRAEIAQLSATVRAQKTAPASEWLSTADVARELGVTPATVCGWVKSRRLRAATGTRYLRIHRGELSRFMAGASEDDGKVESLVSRLRKTRCGSQTTERM